MATVSGKNIMSDLTDDEYTCLMIMNEGQNLIAMENTRWNPSIKSLARKGYATTIGNNNYVITDSGRHACEDREHKNDQALTDLARGAISVHNAQITTRNFMAEAKANLVKAAHAASAATGDTPSQSLRKCLAEVALRAQEDLQ